MIRTPIFAIAALAAGLSSPARADELFAGGYAHAVGTPLSFDTGEGGVDLQLGYRFDRIEELSFLGKPAPYIVGSLSTRGDTSFAGVGLSWRLGGGRFYARPEIGVVVHDGPRLRIRPDGTHTELGSRVLFEPGIGFGARVSPRLSIEASWIHISQARVFDSKQNPGIDMWGARLNWKL
ncbi:MAG: acyloxyacyl hydrolase [Novosphingobium sp.]|nr:acyloxyacyl hydrolase [Novosphingobium sp.]